MDARTQGITLRGLRCLCGLLVVLALPLPAPAATFPDLYTVTVEIDPTARDRRADAIERGMAILLTRVSGRTNAGAAPALEPVVASASRLVTSYGQVDSERVRVGFNGAEVQAQLTALDWPLWGAERPQIVLWAAIDFGDGQRELLAGQPAVGPQARLRPGQAELRDSIVEELLRAADERGLPMQVPLMDERDKRVASYAAVWGGFAEVLLGASARYRGDFALIARISLTDLGLEIDWQLAGADGDSRRLLTSAPREGIDWVADQFAAQFSSTGGLRQTRIDVEGIDSLAEYGRVMRYLETLSIVESVDVASFDGRALNLVASIRGDDFVLDRIFELGGVLQPADAGPFAGSVSPNRRFRLVGDDTAQ